MKASRWISTVVSLVSATITLSDNDRPDAPMAAQRAQGKADSPTWTIPADSAAPITQYEVEDPVTLACSRPMNQRKTPDQTADPETAIKTKEQG